MRPLMRLRGSSLLAAGSVVEGSAGVRGVGSMGGAVSPEAGTEDRGFLFSGAWSDIPSSSVSAKICRRHEMIYDCVLSRPNTEILPVADCVFFQAGIEFLRQYLNFPLN